MKNNDANVGAIIVSYNPESSRLLALCEKLSKQVDVVILVDNGSKNFLDKNLITSDNIIVISLVENLGIATAQNIGINKIVELGLQYVIFFDQDSIVSDGLVNTLKNNFIASSMHEKVAVVGPIFFDYRFLFYYPHIILNKIGIRKRVILKPGDPITEVSFIISSGMFTSVGVLNDVGFMKDELFIDYVDTEWCFRSLSKGYKIFAIPDACMEHAIGDNNIKFLCWKLPVHSPFRRYYRMRNMFYLFKLPYVPLVLKLREFITNNIHQLIITIKSDNKKAYLDSWFKSLVDGIKIMFGSKL